MGRRLNFIDQLTPLSFSSMLPQIQQVKRQNVQGQLKMALFLIYSTGVNI